MDGTTGDGGGENWTPVSTYIGLLGGKTKVISLGVIVIEEWVVSYDALVGSCSPTVAGTSLLG